MAPSVSPRADGRRLDGERDGLKSRGPCRPAAVNPPAMVVEPRPAFSGSRPQRRLPAVAQIVGTSGRPKYGTGHKTPPARVPKGSPLRRAKALLGCGVG